MTKLNLQVHHFDNYPKGFVFMADLAKELKLRPSEILRRFGALEAKAWGYHMTVVSGHHVQSVSMENLIVIADFFESARDRIPEFYVPTQWAQAIWDLLAKGYVRVALEQHYVEPLDEDDPEDKYRINTSNPSTEWLKNWAVKGNPNYWWAIVAYKE